MKEILLQLIQEDIRITALVRSLGKSDIDAHSYLPDIYPVIFKLIGVKEAEEVNDQYFKMVESGMDIRNKDQRLILAQEILAFLKNN